MEPSTRELEGRVRRALGGRFASIELAGEGGMAVVFRTVERGSGAVVALKVFRPELSSFVNEARFVQEGRIATSFRHPNIVPVLETGAEAGLLYLTMPFIEGETLRERLTREGPLPVEEALRITREIGEALAHAHEAGFIHRDISPANIILGPEGAMLADFGVAKALTSAGTDDFTQSGTSIGTPTYMSPEQAAGESLLDTRSDQYSLACVLYEALVGEPPFTGPTSVVVIARHIGDETPSLTVARPGIPPPLAAAVHRALSKTPADRFPTVMAFIEGLTAEGPPAVLRRPWRLVAAAAAVLALLGWGLGQRGAGVDLSDDRVLVFPIDTGPENASLGDQIATYIGYVLEGTDPLVWREARELLGAGVRVSDLSTADRRELATGSGARYFIDGSVIRAADSVTVVLRLHDAASGEMVRRSGRTGDVEASEARLGARAVGELLGGILEPGHRIDMGALADRSPVAIARFHLGEVEYRRSRFDAALLHFESALEDDSVFALAAVRGAQAAMWLEDEPTTARLAGSALARDTLLPERYRRLAYGIDHRFNGRPDSALVHFAFLERRYPDWAEASANVGEIHYHSYPSATGGIGAAYFERAVSLDSAFTPPRYHLAEIAFREGHVPEAVRHLDVLERSDPDPVIRLQLEIMSRCAREDPAEIDWAPFMERDQPTLVGAAQAMASSAVLRECAFAASGAALDPDGTSRWGAYLVHHGILVAERRSAELLALIHSDRMAPLPTHTMSMIDALALPELVPLADSVYLERLPGFEAQGSPTVWLLMHWARFRGRRAEMADIATELVRRAEASNRESMHFSRIADAMLALDRSVEDGVEALRSLAVSGSTQDLVWDPWESLTVERLVLAEALIALGETDEARELLGDMPSHRSVMETWLLPERERLWAALEASAQDDVQAGANEATRPAAPPSRGGSE